jgi:hypothetical protein
MPAVEPLFPRAAKSDVEETLFVTVGRGPVHGQQAAFARLLKDLQAEESTGPKKV